jgi:hypothetical protein
VVAHPAAMIREATWIACLGVLIAGHDTSYPACFQALPVRPQGARQRDIIAPYS